MKKFIVLALIVVMISSFASADLTTDLKLYYTFDDVDLTGSNPDDMTVNANDGTTNGATTGVTGILNQAFEFDGINDKVSADSVIADVDLTVAGDVSVSGWYYIPTGSAISYQGFGVDGSWNNYYSWITSSGYIRGNMRGQAGAWTAPTDTTGWSNEWVHVVTVKDGSTMYVYINGALAVSGTGLSLDILATSFDIGWRHSDAYAFEGKVDEFGIWNMALSLSEISLLYGGGSPCPYSLFATDCVGTPDLTTDLEWYYSFDDADLTGSDPDDMTGNGYDGTTVGATTGVTGILAQAFSYDGVNDWVDTNYNTISSENTYSFWVKTSTTASNGNILGVDGNDRLQIATNLGGVDGKFRIYTKESNSIVTRAYFTEPSWNDDDWHHIVIVYDTQATGDLTTYFDGVSSVVSYDFHLTESPYTLTGDYFIGANNRNDGTANSLLAATIDEVGVWSSLLSSGDVNLIYNAGAGCPYSLFASGCSAPIGGNSLNISTSNPANGTQFNTELLNINLTANASLTFDANLYINGVLNQTAQYLTGVDVFVDFDVPFLNTTEATFTYEVRLNTTDTSKNTTINTFHIDNVFPQITWTTPNNLNTTVIAETLLSNILLQDPNMFSYLYNITRPNGTQYYTSSNATLTGLTNYTINDTVSFVGEQGAFNAFAEVCDGHTDQNITIDSVIINNVTLEVEDEGDSINVSMLDEEDTMSVSYIEEPDKVSFGFVSDTTTSTEEFIVESNHYIHILDGLTQYEGHLVMGKKWMDFETDDLSSVHIVRLTDYSVQVTVTKLTSTDEWDFESIGELNCRNQSRSFLVHVPTTSNNSQVLSGDLSPYLLNVSMDPAYYTSANATLYWNGTGYPATATNTSTHFYFNYTVTIPPLMNDTNVTYYWNYYLGTTEFNTTSENTTVYSPRISNCTDNPTQWVRYDIKDETFETLLNGSITFLFNYYNGAYTNNFNGLMTDNSTFPICMYPSWGNFSTDATIQYQTSEAGYTSREYQTTGFEVYESNRTVDLFLLEGATDITFHIIDDSDNNLQGVTVEAYRYRISTDSDVLVETEATDAEGKIILNLASGTTFYSFKIYDAEGTLKISTARFKLFSTEYEYIIQEGRENPLATRSNILNALTQSITYNVNGNNLINYTYNYTGELVNQWCFTVVANATTYNSQCSNNSAGEFNYTITQFNLSYVAAVIAYTNESDYVVKVLDINTNTQLKDVFGNTNTLFIALIMFLTIGMIGLMSANIAIILSVLALIVIGLFNLLPFSSTWIAGAIALALGLLWVVNKR